MAELRAQRVKPAYEGWNTEAAPDYLGEAQAPLVENLLCRTGKLVLRGPLRYSDDLELAGTAITGLMVKDFNVLVGATAASRQLAVTSTSVTKTNDIVCTSATTPMGRSVELGADSGFAWGRSVDGNFLRWDGTPVAPTSYVLADAPFGIADIAVHAERLFVAGGEVASTGDPNTLLFSDPGGPTLGTAADWTDNTSGLINQIQVGGSEPIVAIYPMGRDLLVMKRRSLYILSGTGASTFQVRRAVSNVGCVDALGVTGVNDTVYFLSDSGFYSYDGAQLRMLSDVVSKDLLEVVNDPNLSHVSAVYLRGDYILLTAAVDSIAYFWAMYDIRRDAWSKFSTTATASSGPFTFAAELSSLGCAVGTDGVGVWELSQLGIPELVTGQALRGFTNYLRDVTIAGAFTTIPGKWHSRMIKLASPLFAAQLHRILVDYRVNCGTSIPAWYITIVRGDGTQAGDTHQVLGEAAALPTFVARRRGVIDQFEEVVDVQLRVELPSTGVPISLAEIYDVTFEYQQARQRPVA